MSSAVWSVDKLANPSPAFGLTRIRSCLNSAATGALVWVKAVAGARAANNPRQHISHAIRQILINIVDSMAVPQERGPGWGGRNAGLLLPLRKIQDAPTACRAHAG